MATNRDQHHYDQDDQGRTPESYNTYSNKWPQQTGYDIPGNDLYGDPAVINPEELASFPKQVTKDNNPYHHHHHESHLVNKRTTPVRDGRNITRTDNHPDRKGFM